MPTGTGNPETATVELEWLEESLDLEMIRFKLANPEEGPDLGPDELDAMEGEYRKFLALKLAFPDAEIVPCKLVDEMWHRHILDTAAYRSDCDRIFGHFVDHFPYFGMRGPDDARDLDDAYAATLDRYRESFGEPPADTWISEKATRCRTACKPQRCR